MEADVITLDAFKLETPSHTIMRRRASYYDRAFRALAAVPVGPAQRSGLRSLRLAGITVLRSVGVLAAVGSAVRLPALQAVEGEEALVDLVFGGAVVVPTGRAKRLRARRG
jgi:hypothetical protein